VPDELLAAVGLCLGTQRCCVGDSEVFFFFFLWNPDF
jgi:hypothetical protein